MNITTNYDSSSISSEESPPLSPTDSKDSRISEIYFTQITIDFATMIPFQIANDRLYQMSGGKAIYGLNTLNLFHFEVMRTLQELMRNRDARKVSQDTLNEIATKFHFIFRALQEGQTSSKLVEAMNLWVEVKDLIPKLKSQLDNNSVRGTNKHIVQLKEYGDIVFHLASKPGLTAHYSKSLRTEKDYHPTAGHMSLYLDSLGCCSKAIDLYRNHLNQGLTLPLEIQINALSKKQSPYLKSLIELLQSYQTKLKTTLNAQRFEDLIANARKLKSNNQVVLNCLANFNSLESFERFQEELFPVRELLKPMQEDLIS